MLSVDHLRQYLDVLCLSESTDAGLAKRVVDILAARSNSLEVLQAGVLVCHGVHLL